MVRGLVLQVVADWSQTGGPVTEGLFPSLRKFDFRWLSIWTVVGCYQDIVVSILFGSGDVSSEALQFQSGKRWQRLMWWMSQGDNTWAAWGNSAFANAEFLDEPSWSLQKDSLSFVLPRKGAVLQEVDRNGYYVKFLGFIFDRIFRRPARWFNNDFFSRIKSLNHLLGFS